MDLRQNQISSLKSYINNVDKEMTMILQNLQWNPQNLISNEKMAVCSYNSNHSIPESKITEHEKKCYLKWHGYLERDKFFTEPFNLGSKSIVKFDKNDIQQIIANASKTDSQFKLVLWTLTGSAKRFIQIGSVSAGPEPLTNDRLVSTYTSDERRAIYDAVVAAAPACHDLTDLALTSHGDNERTSTKSRLEILSELRDMKRRRARYRGVAGSSHYSDELRGLIATQMEYYTEALGLPTKESKAKEVAAETFHGRPPIGYKHVNDTNGDSFRRPNHFDTDFEHTRDRRRDSSRYRSEKHKSPGSSRRGPEDVSSKRCINRDLSDTDESRRERRSHDRRSDHQRSRRSDHYYEQKDMHGRRHEERAEGRKRHHDGFDYDRDADRHREKRRRTYEHSQERESKKHKKKKC